MPKQLRQLARYLRRRPQSTYYGWLVLGLLLPNVALALAPQTSWVGALVGIIMPMGLWMMLLTLSERPGRVVLLGLPLLLLVNCAQLVLLTIFDGAVISVDLLLSLFSASGDEAGELLGGLILPIAIVLLLHFAYILLALWSWRSPGRLQRPERLRRAALGALLLILGLPLAAWARALQPSHTLRGEVYPLNVFYNMYIAGSKLSQLASLGETSAGHSYRASSERPEAREVYVMVLGETSRAYSYQLYGYERETNPCLSARRMTDSASLVIFRDLITQSNTTSKSVPILLSPADAEHSERLPYVKGIMTAMREAGFYTVFISNQPANRSFLDHLAFEANEHYRVRDILRAEREFMDLSPIYDGEMLPFLDRALRAKHQKLFVILHGYGAHWSYRDRYPEAFRHFRDDEALGASPRERERLLNGYDNATRYNDYFLESVIERLEPLPAQTAMYYTADHGEDVFDDARERILHSSPTVSYYQLHVPGILWLSPSYREAHPELTRAAHANADRSATSRSTLHTLLELAGVQSYERQDTLSLVSPHYREGLRSYLNDRYECVPTATLLTEEEDLRLWRRLGLKPL